MFEYGKHYSRISTSVLFKRVCFYRNPCVFPCSIYSGRTIVVTIFAPTVCLAISMPVIFRSIFHPFDSCLCFTHISYLLIILRKIVLFNKFRVVCHIGRTCGISVSLDGFQIFLRISDPFKILISGKLNELKVTPDTFLHRIIDTEIVFDRSQRTYGVLFLSSHIDTLACPLRTAFESEVVMISGSKFGIAPTRFKNCLCNDRAMYFDPVLCCILLYELRYLFNKFLIRHNVSLLCEEGRMALPCAY